MKLSALSHEKISPTAKLVAYWRQFSDVPFGKDIASLFHTEEVCRTMLNEDVTVPPEVWAPFFELRYKFVEHFVKKSGIQQVLEFASGISMRGLAMTADPNIVYVESDLPTLTEEKLKVVETLMKKHGISERKNLFFHSANILSYEEIEKCLVHFDKTKPLLLTHEGLFHYLTREEKRIAAQNIHKVLTQFKGVWITPDLDTKDSLRKHFLTSDTNKKTVDLIRKATDCSFEDNAFESDADIARFFGDLGFKIETRLQMDKSIPLSSLSQLTKDGFQALEDLRFWMFTTR